MSDVHVDTAKLPDDSDVEARSPDEHALLQSAAAARARRKFDLIVVPLVTMFCEFWNAYEYLRRYAEILVSRQDFLSFLVSSSI